MSAPSQLSIYNRAVLEFLGEAPLTALTDARSVRTSLDHAWSNGRGHVHRCLEEALWKHALRSIEITYDPDVSPPHGLRYAFSKPDDWVKTSGVWGDEYHSAPYLDYRDEGGYWLAELDTLYIQYVSNDAAYGADFEKWPAKFETYVCASLALAVSASGKNKRGEDLKEEVLFLLKEAKTSDAANDPQKRLPYGSLVRARFGKHSSGEGSTRGPLFG